MWGGASSPLLSRERVKWEGEEAEETSTTRGVIVHTGSGGGGGGGEGMRYGGVRGEEAVPEHRSPQLFSTAVSGTFMLIAAKGPSRSESPLPEDVGGGGESM